MQFEWHPEKAEANLNKHDVAFDEAATVFQDVNANTFYDPAHSKAEDRFLELGISSSGRLLVVSYTWRGDDIRIISARKADRIEYRNYGN